MQFDNFFIDYKLRLKTISERIIWSKLPLYRKISLIAMILLFLVMLVALIFQNRDLQFTVIELSILFCAILGIYIMFAVLSPILKDLIYRDYSKYNSLIYDLNQIKIFQPNQIASSSNHLSSSKDK